MSLTSRTAIHEAAHAVVGLALGLPVVAVAIDGTDPDHSGGACLFVVAPEASRTSGRGRMCRPVV